MFVFSNNVRMKKTVLLCKNMTSIYYHEIVIPNVSMISWNSLAFLFNSARICATYFLNSSQTEEEPRKTSNLFPGGKLSSGSDVDVAHGKWTMMKKKRRDEITWSSRECSRILAN